MAGYAAGREWRGLRRISPQPLTSLDSTASAPKTRAANDTAASTDPSAVPTGGDIITAIDGQPVHGFDDLTAYLFMKTSVGQTVTLTILRDGKSMDVKATLAARPAATASQGQ